MQFHKAEIRQIGTVTGPSYNPIISGWAFDGAGKNCIGIETDILGRTCRVAGFTIAELRAISRLAGKSGGVE